MTKQEKIKNLPLFKELSEKHQTALSAVTHLKTFSRQQSIFSEGDPGNGFYVIVSGKAKIFKISPDGKEQILHIFSTGDTLGEAMAFLDRPYPAFAEALETTETLYVPRSGFLQIVHAYPEIAMSMLAILSQRLHRFTLLIDDLSLKEVPARLARYILHHTDQSEDSSRLDLDISKNQLASIIGTIPETLSRAFRKMSNAGIIKTGGSSIEIKDRNRLEELSWSGKI